MLVKAFRVLPPREWLAFKLKTGDLFHKGVQMMSLNLKLPLARSKRVQQGVRVAVSKSL